MQRGRLSGKAALVTGGAMGIGRSAAMLMAQEGAAVAVADREENAGYAVVQEIEGEYTITDKGVTLGEPLRGFRGLTSGIPGPWSLESDEEDPVNG